MTECIFRFWVLSEDIYDVRTGHFTHPEDRPVFNWAGEHGFNLKCLPGNWIGPLRDAKLVLLFLSPGLADMDLAHSKRKDGRAYYEGQWRGETSLPNTEEHESAWEWWTSRVRSLLNAEGLDPIDNVSKPKVTNHVAILNMAAYKSRRFTDHHLLAALPSSRCAVSWAHEELFPDALKGDRMVVCLRSAKWWGLKAGEKGEYGKALYAPKTTPGGNIHNGDLKKKIARDARQRLGLH